MIFTLKLVNLTKFESNLKNNWDGEVRVLYEKLKANNDEKRIDLDFEILTTIRLNIL